MNVQSTNLTELNELIYKRPIHVAHALGISTKGKSTETIIQECFDKVSKPTEPPSQKKIDSLKVSVKSEASPRKTVEVTTGGLWTMEMEDEGS